MQKRKVEIVKEERVFDGYLKVDQASIKDTSEDGSVSTYTRQKVSHTNAVAGLVYNTDTESIVLVKQYRYPTQTKNNDGFIFEAIALSIFFRKSLCSILRKY